MTFTDSRYLAGYADEARYLAHRTDDARAQALRYIGYGLKLPPTCPYNQGRVDAALDAFG